MKDKLVLAMDVGGTSVKACVVERGEVLRHTLTHYPSYGKEPAAVIIGQLAAIVTDLLRQYVQLTQRNLPDELCVGLAFPGPFDYDEGTCWIRGLDKFESLYGVNVRERLLEELHAFDRTQPARQFKVVFQNDARLFGLGASVRFPDERLAVITLGTGIGSCFIDRGKLVTKGPSVPADGYLFGLPHGEGIADHCFSRRGILALFREAGYSDDGYDVKEYAELARRGDARACELFWSFGLELGSFLAPFMRQFSAERLVIGGQIAGSLDLFDEGLQQGLQTGKCYIVVEALEDALYHTFIGASRMFL
ncbi:ROK family protein [Paenibacillus chungangensis]|uniref:ROK family protein n=1 Tax=Paenibacillus chungangensis TaxID=696535 RepID=A0ABW3HKY2_9BACL